MADLHDNTPLRLTLDEVTRAGARIKVTGDESVRLKRELDDLKKRGLLAFGAVLVILALMLLDWKAVSLVMGSTAVAIAGTALSLYILKIPANLLTLARVPLAFVFLGAYPHGAAEGCRVALAAAFATALAIELTDLADGYVARRLGCVTDFGKLVDPFCDAFARLVVFFTLAAAAFRGGAALVPLWMPALLLLRDLAVAGRVGRRHGRHGQRPGAEGAVRRQRQVARVHAARKSHQQAAGGAQALLEGELFSLEFRGDGGHGAKVPLSFGGRRGETR